MASFEDQLAELERVLDRLEKGDLPLEESVGLFERGMFLSNSCKAVLANAESRIRVLLEPEGGGDVRTEEIDVDDPDEDDEEEEEQD